MGNIIKSCYNCKHCIAIPRNNRYNDIDYLCVVNSYFTIDIHKDISRIKHLHQEAENWSVNMNLIK